MVSICFFFYMAYGSLWKLHLRSHSAVKSITCTIKECLKVWNNHTQDNLCQETFYSFQQWIALPLSPTRETSFRLSQENYSTHRHLPPTIIHKPLNAYHTHTIFDWLLPSINQLACVYVKAGCLTLIVVIVTPVDGQVDGWPQRTQGHLQRSGGLWVLINVTYQCHIHAEKQNLFWIRSTNWPF